MTEAPAADWTTAGQTRKRPATSRHKGPFGNRRAGLLLRCSSHAAASYVLSAPTPGPGG